MPHRRPHSTTTTGRKPQNAFVPATTDRNFIFCA
uniref:Uncharacterized protein n=1 Tax=Anopheles albimanus TaxID=7167 RepID=A0A182FD86_ANOAL